MTTYADQRAHDVAWMTAAERDTYNGAPPGSTIEQRRALCAATVTLNGQPAQISGAACAFATVRQVATVLGAEWAWPTVAHVVANGGAFKS